LAKAASKVALSALVAAERQMEPGYWVPRGNLRLYAPEEIQHGTIKSTRFPFERVHNPPRSHSVSHAPFGENVHCNPQQFLGVGNAKPWLLSSHSRYTLDRTDRVILHIFRVPPKIVTAGSRGLQRKAEKTGNKIGSGHNSMLKIEWECINQLSGQIKRLVRTFTHDMKQDSVAFASLLHFSW